MEFRIWHPGEEDDGEIDLPGEGLHTLALRELETEVAAQGGVIAFENHGIQAGDHITLVVAIATLALQVPAATENMAKLASRLREYLKIARESRKCCAAAADPEALRLLAYDEVRRSNPRFRTDPDLVQVMPDGARRFRALSPNNESYEGFPVGIFVYRIPDLENGRTHTIELRSNGEILDHRIRDELTDDAKEYVEISERL